MSDTAKCTPEEEEEETIMARYSTTFGINHAALAYAMTTLGSSMINHIFSFYYVKLFLNKYKISEGAFHQSQVSILQAMFL